MKVYPDKDKAFPNPAIPSLCYIKNVVKNPRIIIGDYTYYDDIDGADRFEEHVTHFYEFIGDKLIIGNFCAIAKGVTFMYWCCGHLADRSIIVMDGAGKYYHVGKGTEKGTEKGTRKRYIASNLPAPGEEDFDTVIKKLKAEAGRRAEENARKRQQDEEAKRRRRLEEIRDVLPYRMGMKWG